MNFYDIYTTLNINPDSQHSVETICEYCKCLNQLESLKQALWKKPSRVQMPGAFPFDEETGKIYDALWKAAQAENYSTIGKVGRWMMKLICPPADDEGMGRFHAKYHEAPEDETRPAPKPQTSTSNYTPSAPSTTNTESVTQQPEPEPSNEGEWQIEESPAREEVLSRNNTESVSRRAASKKDD